MNANDFLSEIFSINQIMVYSFKFYSESFCDNLDTSKK